jgi:hypothetical protein
MGLIRNFAVTTALKGVGKPIRLEPIDMRQGLPALQDDSGYCVTTTDLEHLSISQSAFGHWLAGERPLGFASIAYKAFVSDLGRALRADGVDPQEVDIRLKGSSTAFFAGRHKTLPDNRREIVQAFRRLRGRLPQLFELREIERGFDEIWPLLGPRPLRRRVPSDYDLQLSSDVIVAKCEKAAEHIGLEATRETTHHDVYNFVRWDLVQAAMPHVADFASLMSDALRRYVGIAVFESCGPPNLSAEVGGLSSHFRAEDWVITCPDPNDGGGQQ